MRRGFALLTLANRPEGLGPQTARHRHPLRFVRVRLDLAPTEPEPLGVDSGIEALAPRGVGAVVA